MSRFNSDAEEQQRCGDMSIRQTGVFQAASKSQAMHQSKHEGHDPRRASGDADVATAAAQISAATKTMLKAIAASTGRWRDVDVAERRQS